ACSRGWTASRSDAHVAERAASRNRWAAAPPAIVPLYSGCVLCPARRRVQTLPLALKSDPGSAAEAGCASPPSSGKPEGFQAVPLEPRVQGRFARIATAEDVFRMKRAA